MFSSLYKYSSSGIPKISGLLKNPGPVFEVPLDPLSTLLEEAKTEPLRVTKLCPSWLWPGHHTDDLYCR